MITRRAFVAGSVTMLAAPLAAEAQQARKVYRIGLLDHGDSDPVRTEWWNAFRQRLRELDYLEGRNVAFELRWGRGDVEQTRSLAAELVRLKVDLIVTASTPAALAAKHATSTIPIVTASGSDPVAFGLVASLARPGGNVTGMTTVATELSGKRLDIARELFPNVSRVALLWLTTSKANELFVTETQAAAARAGLTLQVVGIENEAGLEPAFRAMSRERASGVIVMPAAGLFRYRNRLADLGLKHRLPTIFGSKEYVEVGGFASYGADLRDLYRRAGDYVDRILKGARPADLPVEQPTKFELVINLKTAKALGLTIPPSLLLRADQVIND